MSRSKFSRIWLVILTLSLLSGIVAVIKEGWNVGDTMGLTVWLVLAAVVAVVIRRENRTKAN